MRIAHSNREPVTVERLRVIHAARRNQIRARLREFHRVWRTGSDALLWEEMVYCIFTAGSSAKMGSSAVAAVRPLLKDGSRVAMTRALARKPAYRFYNVRPEYVVATRDYLEKFFSM